MCSISYIWNSKNEGDWNKALINYWKYVKPQNLQLERKLQNLDINCISSLDKNGWYYFLYNEYFRWKYTAPNRYATTTNSLKKYKVRNELTKLFEIKQVLLAIDKSEIKPALRIAQEIYELGIAGASGLLSLMYPNYFATVEQFVVKALNKIPDLEEHNELHLMKSDRLTLRDGTILINIMRRKAIEINDIFSCTRWTPRKIDMILWATR